MEMEMGPEDNPSTKRRRVCRCQQALAHSLASGVRKKKQQSLIGSHKHPLWFMQLNQCRSSDLRTWLEIRKTELSSVPLPLPVRVCH